MQIVRLWIFVGCASLAAAILSACSTSSLSSTPAPGDRSTLSAPESLRGAGSLAPSSLGSAQSVNARALFCPQHCPTPTPTPLPPLTIDMRDYMTQPLSVTTNGSVQPGTGAMLCNQSNGSGECFTSYRREGEFEFVDNNGVHDYYAVLQNGQIGVVRSYDVADGLRCFSSPGSPCTAPPASNNVPQAVPLVMRLNSVSYQTELAAENSNNTPRTTIAQAISPTGGSYVSFQNNTMNVASCAQKSIGSTPAYVMAVYVTGIPFGGTIGTQNAVVIDEYEQGPTVQQNHIERYYYVHGFGRVREGASLYDVNTGVYDLLIPGEPPNNRDRNIESAPSTLASQPNQCPQNSYTPLLGRNSDGT